MGGGVFDWVGRNPPNESEILGAIIKIMPAKPMVLAENLNAEFNTFAFSIQGAFGEYFNKRDFDNSFIGKFAGIETIDEVRQIALEYGLFCVHVVQKGTSDPGTYYVWLPYSKDKKLLTMQHNFNAIHDTLDNKDLKDKTDESRFKSFYDSIVKKINQIFTVPQRGGGRYTSKTLKELQAIAKARKIPYSNLKKADLIAALRQGKKKART